MPCICLPKLTTVFSTLQLISYNGYNTLVLLSHWGKIGGAHGCFCLFCYRHIRKGWQRMVLVIHHYHYASQLFRCLLEKKLILDNIWQQYNIIMLSTKMKILSYNSQLYSAFWDFWTTVHFENHSKEFSV